MMFESISRNSALARVSSSRYAKQGATYATRTTEGSSDRLDRLEKIVDSLVALLNQTQNHFPPRTSSETRSAVPTTSTSAISIEVAVPGTSNAEKRSRPCNTGSDSGSTTSVRHKAKQICSKNLLSSFGEESSATK